MWPQQQSDLWGDSICGNFTILILIIRQLLKIFNISFVLTLLNYYKTTYLSYFGSSFLVSTFFLNYHCVKKKYKVFQAFMSWQILTRIILSVLRCANYLHKNWLAIITTAWQKHAPPDSQIATASAVLYRLCCIIPPLLYVLYTHPIEMWR